MARCHRSGRVQPRPDAHPQPAVYRPYARPPRRRVDRRRSGHRRTVAKTRDQARSTGLVALLRAEGEDAPREHKAAPRYGELVGQYLMRREEHPGVLLLFRVGSFYEVLFDDAELVARGLGLKLSDRPSGGSARADASPGDASAPRAQV